MTCFNRLQRQMEEEAGRGEGNRARTTGTKKNQEVRRKTMAEQRKRERGSWSINSNKDKGQWQKDSKRDREMRGQKDGR